MPLAGGDEARTLAGMTEDVRREVAVAAGQHRAFELFTDHIGAWWPLEEHGVFRDSTVSLEGDLLVERSGDQESVWGEVLAWDPDRAVTLTWHPGSAVEHATELNVEFVAVADETLVTIIHTGWERMPDPDAAAAEYGFGWPGVLTRFRELVDEVGA